MNDAAVNRSKASNDHRLTSIREREKQKEAQKHLITHALRDLGSLSNPNHVTFSDSDDDDSARKGGADLNPRVSGDQLLGFDGDDDMDITIEPRFKSKNAEKLLHLQSRYGNDSRFRLDDKFAESSDSEEDQNSTTGNDDEMTDEAKRNMHLVDQIAAGYSSTAKSRKLRSAETFSAKSSQRYDPSYSNSMELNMNKSNATRPVKKKTKTPVVNVETPYEPGSFYNVSSDVLRNAFAASHNSNTQQSNTFSFIEALKLDPEVADDNTLKENVNKVNNFCMDSDISEDTSSSDEEIPMIVSPPENNEGAKPPTKSTFFPVSPSDPMILGAAKRFCWNKTYQQMQQEWLEVKDILIKDYKKKHRDAKKKHRDTKKKRTEYLTPNDL